MRLMLKITVKSQLAINSRQFKATGLRVSISLPAGGSEQRKTPKYGSLFVMKL